MPIILTINAGSSSIKYQCFEMIGEVCLAKGIIGRLNTSLPNLTFDRHDGYNYQIDVPQIDYDNAFSFIRASLIDPQHGVLDDLSAITAIGHRVVHGGEHFTDRTLITPIVEGQIDQLSDLAPLHNPFNLKGIRACRQILPETPQVAVFDTAFHHTIPDHAHIYPLPIEFYRQHQIRRYGFHGTSHRYVVDRIADLAKKPIETMKIISCHLGSGCSVTAIDGGKSIDTSMGFTPLEGLMMGTRCGDIDPAIIFHLIRNHEMSIDDVEEILNHDSGLLGVSGVSSDLENLLEAVENGNDQALLSLKMFCYRVSQYIGKYTATLGGLSALIFTGGMGENSSRIRSKICENLGFIGIQLDPNRNGSKRIEKAIHRKNSPVQIWVIPTDEELMIARDTFDLIENLEPIDCVAEFNRLIQIAEEREPTKDLPVKKVKAETSDQKPKTQDSETPIAPSAWLSVYKKK